MRDALKKTDWLLVAFTIGAVGIVARGLIHWISHHYNLSMEYMSLFAAINVSEDAPLYPQQGHTPYYLMLYPPLHALTLGSFLSIFPNDWIYTKVLVIRGTSLACFLLAVRLLWSYTKPVADVRYFLLATLLAAPKIADYFTTGRNDMWALCLDAITFCACVRYLRDSTRRNLAMILVWAVLGFFSRQLSIVVMGAFLLMLLLRYEWKKAVGLGLLYSLTVLLGIWICQWATGGVYLDHVYFANLRSIYNRWQELPTDPSMILGFLSYFIFFALTLIGLFQSIVKKIDVRDEELDRFMAVLVGTSFLSGMYFFLYPASGLNYFFQAIFFSIYFATKGLVHLVRSAALHRFAKAAVLTQLLFSTGVLIGKSWNAYQIAFLPYDDVLAKVQVEEGASRGLVESSSLGIGMVVRLKDWWKYSPDVAVVLEQLAGPYPKLSREKGKRFRWIQEDIQRAVESREITKVVTAEPGCANRKPYFAGFSYDLLAEFTELKEYAPWLCVFTRRRDPGQAQ